MFIDIPNSEVFERNTFQDLKNRNLEELYRESLSETKRITADISIDGIDQISKKDDLFQTA